MSQLKICRICLRTEAKMFKMNVYGLQWYYEELLDFKVDINDRLPQYFCFECAALLHKFHNFKEKCCMGQKILNDMDMEGAITYESIYKLDRKQLKLISLLDYMIPNTKADTIFTVKNVSMDKTLINGKRDKIQIQQESDVENNKKDLDVLAEQEIMCDIEMIKAEKTDDVPFYIEKESTVGYNYNNIEYNYDDEIHDDSSVDSKPSASKNLTGIFIVDKNEDVTAKKLRPRRLKQPKKESVKKIKTEKTDKNKSVSLRHLRARRPKPPKKIKVAVKIPEILNSGNWKKTTLSEEEATRTFNAKSLEEKYISATYKCTDCFIPFSNNEICTRHRQKWHTELNYRFECKFCKRRFRRHHQLKKHIKAHYERYQCLRCDLVCPLESTVMIHDASHSGAIYKCEVCHQEYKHTSTYYSHMRTAHKHKHLCNLCGRSFVNELGLNQHKKRTHFINDKGEPLGVNKDSPDVEEVVNTYCSTCDIKFETEDAYHEHKLHSSKHGDGMDNRERKPRRRKPMDCPKCGESFKSQAACWKHCRKEHPNDKLIPTMLCETKSICEICGVSVSSNNLRLHMMNRHEKKYECYCNICGKRFSMKASLKIHSVVHTGEKPFKCSLCDKSFTQKGSMNLHYRTYHLKEPYPKRNRNTIGSLRNDPGDFYPIP